jgi:hypothetical protein
MRKREFMPEKKFKSIAEIDAELDQAFKEAQKAEGEETESEETDETVEAEPVEAANEETSEEAKEQPEEKEPEAKPEDKKDVKPIKDNKQDYAFKQLREEADNAKKELSSKKQVLSEIELLAQSQGFNSVDEFLAAWKERQIEEQAKKQNTDPKVLKELQQTKERLSKIEQERNEVVKNTNINRVNNAIAKFAASNKLADSDMNKIIANMDADQVTVDMLVAAPNETLEKMLTGYAQDIIIERKVQEKLAAMEKSDTTPAPEKHKNTVSSKKPDPFSKEALEDEMATFRKQNYPWLK